MIEVDWLNAFTISDLVFFGVWMGSAFEENDNLVSVPLMYKEEGDVLIALDSRGSLIPARQAPERQDRINISFDRISTGHVRVDRTVSRMLKACRDSGGTKRTLPPAALVKTSDGRTVLVDVFRVPRQIGGALHGARFLLILREVVEISRSRKTHLRHRFSLTAAEAEVADLLAQGKSLTEATQALGISIWTVRSHLRAIFQKTNTHRQGALVALVNSLSD